MANLESRIYTKPCGEFETFKRFDVSKHASYNFILNVLSFGHIYSCKGIAILAFQVIGNAIDISVSINPEWFVIGNGVLNMNWQRASFRINNRRYRVHDQSAAEYRSEFVVIRNSFPAVIGIHEAVTEIEPGFQSVITVFS